MNEMEQNEYRGLEERLSTWRRALLWRQRRLGEIDQVPDPGYHERNLAARRGVVVRVDSYLGTINTERSEDAYWPLYEVDISIDPAEAPGWVTLRFATDGPHVTTLWLRLNGGAWRVARFSEMIQLAPGRTVVEARVENAAGWYGRTSRIVLSYDPTPEWPEGLRTLEADNGQVAPGRYPFGYEGWPEPTLLELRRRFELDRLVEGATSDLERMVRLRDWIKSLWSHRLPWRHPPYNGLLILDRASRGVETFICMHYSIALIHCCLSLGMQARLVNLHRGIAPSYPIGRESEIDPPVDEHVVAEVWCAEHRKWVMMDTDFDCHYELEDVPLSALDLHEIFLSGETGRLTVRQGPGAAQYESLGPDFYQHRLPAYYAHFSILMRNDFLSDPDGPIPALHLTDDSTPPILWYRGEDMRLHPYLLGPMVVANPYTDTTPLLTDGNLETGWASADSCDDHWVEITFPSPVTMRRVVLHWAEWQGYYRASRAYLIEARLAGRWTPVAEVRGNPERAWTVHDFAPVTAEALRLIQSPGDGFPEHPNRLWLTQIEVF